MNSEQKNLITALVLSGAILFGWQFWMTKNHPVEIAPLQTTTNVATGTAQSASSNPASAQQSGATASTTAQSQPEFSLNLVDGKELKLKNPFEIVEIGSHLSEKSLQDILGDIGSLTIETEKAGKFEPLLLVDGPVVSGQPHGIVGGGEVVLTSEHNFVGLKVTSPIPVNYRFGIRANALNEAGSKRIRQYIVYPSGPGRWNVGKDNDGESKSKWFGVDFSHNLFAVSFSEPSDIRFQSTELGNLNIVTAQPRTELSLKLNVAQKNYDTLASLGNNLEQAVDFGMLWFISLPILRALQFIHSIIPNYGIGIILLTLLMRLLTYPLQYKSFVSMKKMQNLNPELQKIKEKYPEDKAKVQQETMELFKRTGVNPLGGCLPLLLQMPIFFAFYRVLQESVELVGAPFYFWVTDLGQKDPYYILPFFVGLVMLINQKMTPSPSVDPVQKKIMMAMPIVFAFFMKDLPSGLNVYFLVSMTAGIFQQLYVYKKLEKVK